MDTNSDYNQRQYRRMLELLNAYEAKHIGLGKLITNLEGLLGCIENISDDWRQSFLKKWGVLEDVYSIAVDRQTELDTEDHLLIASAIAEIKKLIRAVLDQSPTEGDIGNL